MRPQTPAERLATLLYIAAVDEREAAARQHQPEFAEWLLECAARARAEAASIDTTPEQGRLAI
ncbi:hypothetical protein SAMN04489859_1008108 [Paracoccus alcaliphilus]|uniref:Uncharacterized protein n=1 Tax=Paracoccus alcaliphilus TaxID=34002 RepID=A0A1H8H627_9RHOB|nr:hypothetical protein [Paracoccus alcaliphilus]WCR17385.1 hypothetical protein JHW40_13690 [Paracoccus alcaliphilus]SEN50928.1 hypothetical protein SAMN04489859_1008108 [Paracoccus alcaliphilus]